MAIQGPFVVIQATSLFATNQGGLIPSINKSNGGNVQYEYKCRQPDPYQLFKSGELKYCPKTKNSSRRNSAEVAKSIAIFRNKTASPQYTFQLVYGKVVKYLVRFVKCKIILIPGRGGFHSSYKTSKTVRKTITYYLTTLAVFLYYAG